MYEEGSCALGTLTAEIPANKAIWYAGSEGASHTAGSAGQSRLAATGDVTLFNRGDIEAALWPGEPGRSDCADGELLVRLYARAGPKALSAVRGMFSLAVWDGASLVLITDPIGSRSIFYTRCEGSWVVASSLRALRRWPRLMVRVNPAAVRSFLTFGFLPGQDTLLDGVFRMPPASCLKLNEDGTSEIRTYWEPMEGPWDLTDPPETYAAQLRDLLEEATELCLPQREDVGVFLSGGLDSSLVTGLAAELHDRSVRTYTINFGADQPNELAYANLVAAHCGTDHRVLTYTGKEVVSHFLETAALMDCPVGEGLTVPNLLLCRAAAEDGLRIVLNGEGGDPLFGGPKNIPMLVFEFHRQDPDPGARARAYLRAYRHMYDDLATILTPDFQRALEDAQPMESIVQPYLESDRMRYFLNRLMFTNLRLKGPGFMTAKVEFMPTSCGLQGRYPLFDHRVVEYSFQIPPRYKLWGTTEKFVLKQAVRDLLPAEIIQRPKSGMRMPMRHWLKGPLKALVHTLLLDARGRERGIFQVDVIGSWLKGQGLVWRRHGQRLWLAAMLEAWLRTWVDAEEYSAPVPNGHRWWKTFSIRS